MKQYYVYILTNWNNKVLYTGVTNNLERRMYEHQEKLIEGFTKKYNVNKLVYCEIFSSPHDAITVEKKIKGWTRSKKVSLIEKFNPTWEDLMKDSSLRSE